MIRKVVRIGILYTGCFPHTVIFGWVPLLAEGREPKSQSEHFNKQELLHCSNAQHGHSQNTPLHQGVKMFLEYFSWEWGEGGFPPAFKKQSNPKIRRKKTRTTENPPNPTTVLSLKILQIQSLNFADCFVQFWFLRIFPHTVLTWSFITAIIVSAFNILLRTSLLTFPFQAIVMSPY